eukprot:280366-Chlamydomonas_euryale.AAC.1
MGRQGQQVRRAGVSSAKVRVCVCCWWLSARGRAGGGWAVGGRVGGGWAGGGWRGWGVARVQP